MNIIEVVEYSGVKLRKKGSLYTGLCPFHDDKRDGNFFVYPHTDSFYCFACQTGGSKSYYIQIHPQCKDLVEYREIDRLRQKLSAKASGSIDNYKIKILECGKSVSNHAQQIMRLFRSLNFIITSEQDLENIPTWYRKKLELEQYFDYLLHQIDNVLLKSFVLSTFKELSQLHSCLIQLKLQIEKLVKQV